MSTTQPGDQSTPNNSGGQPSVTGGQQGLGADPNGTNTNPGSQTQNNNQQPADKHTWSRGYNEGVQTQHERFRTTLATFGIKPVIKKDDATGDIDYDYAGGIKAYLDDLQSRLVDPEKISAEMQAQIQAAQLQVQQVEQEKAQLKHDHELFKVRTQLGSTFSNLQAVDVNAAIDLFFASHDITWTQEGLMRIKEKGKVEVVRNTQLAPATLEEAATMFLQAKPYLIRGQARNGQDARDTTGTGDDFQRRFAAASPEERVKMTHERGLAF